MSKVKLLLLYKVNNLDLGYISCKVVLVRIRLISAVAIKLYLRQYFLK